MGAIQGLTGVLQRLPSQTVAHVSLRSACHVPAIGKAWHTGLITAGGTGQGLPHALRETEGEGPEPYLTLLRLLSDPRLPRPPAHRQLPLLQPKVVCFGPSAQQRYHLIASTSVMIVDL